jgi:dTDP-4-amino-4,6-dideoxygalactose transaminase
MEFIDLTKQQQRIRGHIEANIKTVLDHCQFILGPEIEKLENKLAEYVEVKHAVACASGTDALLLGLMAKNIGPGDGIFTTPFTFIATAEVISLTGAVPIYVDIDPRSFNIDPNKLELAIQAIEKEDPTIHPLPSTVGRKKSAIKPKGVITVDLFGLAADYDRINAIAKKHDLFVIEDAAQSFGAEYKGRKACSLAEVACTSFFPSKPLSCYGDGGMCFCDDDDLADLLRSLLLHGKGNHKYDNVRVGINGRLDTLQAAILLAKFDLFPEEIELRQNVARRYSEPLKRIKSLTTPWVPNDGHRSAWALYSILARDEEHRSALQKRLKTAGIPTAVYYPKPLHLQTAFASLGYREGDFPESEDCSNRIFSLPMHPYLQEKEQQLITDILSTSDE